MHCYTLLVKKQCQRGQWELAHLLPGASCFLLEHNFNQKYISFIIVLQD